ncbi:UNVERIFIED_CONTAM: hypothetical protein K2H54_048142, partial [Gekko kuhli]
MTLEQLEEVIQQTRRDYEQATQKLSEFKEGTSEAPQGLEAPDIRALPPTPKGKFDDVDFNGDIEQSLLCEQVVTQTYPVSPTLERHSLPGRESEVGAEIQADIGCRIQCTGDISLTQHLHTPQRDTPEHWAQRRWDLQEQAKTYSKMLKQAYTASARHEASMKEVDEKITLSSDPLEIQSLVQQRELLRATIQKIDQEIVQLRERANLTADHLALLGNNQHILSLPPRNPLIPGNQEKGKDMSPHGSTSSPEIFPPKRQRIDDRVLTKEASTGHGDAHFLMPTSLRMGESDPTYRYRLSSSAQEELSGLLAEGEDRGEHVGKIVGMDSDQNPIGPQEVNPKTGSTPETPQTLELMGDRKIVRETRMLQEWERVRNLPMKEGLRLLDQTELQKIDLAKFWGFLLGHIGLPGSPTIVVEKRSRDAILNLLDVFKPTLIRFLTERGQKQTRFMDRVIHARSLSLRIVERLIVGRKLRTSLGDYPIWLTEQGLTKTLQVILQSWEGATAEDVTDVYDDPRRLETELTPRQWNDWCLQAIHALKIRMDRLKSDEAGQWREIHRGKPPIFSPHTTPARKKRRKLPAFPIQTDPDSERESSESGGGPFRTSGMRWAHHMQQGDSSSEGPPQTVTATVPIPLPGPQHKQQGMPSNDGPGVPGPRHQTTLEEERHQDIELNAGLDQGLDLGATVEVRDISFQTPSQPPIGRQDERGPPIPIPTSSELESIELEYLQSLTPPGLLDTGHQSIHGDRDEESPFVSGLLTPSPSPPGNPPSGRRELPSEGTPVPTRGGRDGDVIDGRDTEIRSKGGTEQVKSYAQILRGQRDTLRRDTGSRTGEGIGTGSRVGARQETREMPRRSLDYERVRQEEDEFLQEFFDEQGEPEQDYDPRQRYVIRLRYKGTDIQKLSEDYVVGEFLLRQVGFPREEVLAVIMPPGSRETDICLPSERAYQKLWGMIREALRKQLHLMDDYDLVPLFRGESRVLTVSFRTTNVPEEDVELWLQRYCKVLIPREDERQVSQEMDIEEGRPEGEGKSQEKEQERAEEMEVVEKGAEEREEREDRINPLNYRRVRLNPRDSREDSLEVFTHVPLEAISPPELAIGDSICEVITTSFYVLH